MKRFFKRFHKMSRVRARVNANARRAAFTLIEMLVVIGISTLVSAAAIIYSNVGQNEVALTVETAKVAQLILQARELALDTYSVSSGACGYGVHFDLNSQPQTYSLFAYTPETGGRCPSLATVMAGGLSSSTMMSQYAPSSWQLPVAQGVSLVVPGTAPCNNPMTDILFYPPAPTTLIVNASNRNGMFSSPSLPESSICFMTTDGNNAASVTVNPEGQINF
jgi:prepilin-type N-terminal cleavage/methylation domain-containing protein